MPTFPLLPLLAADPATAVSTDLLPVPTWFWFAFCAVVALLLALDMFVFHRHAHTPTLRESAGWTLFWMSLAGLFDLWIWWQFGHADAALAFLTGYLVEWSLSMDNVFVFVVIFTYFRVPLKYQYRVLFWGILGAVGMRLLFILVAYHLLEHFEWVFYVFGLFLIYTGIRLAVAHGAEAHPDQNVVLRLARRYLRVAHGDYGDRFFVREAGRACITHLFLVLVVVESTDVVFAIDSVPAIFGVTRDPFVVFTSNVFAIMGLRALYFLLAGVVDMFRYLNYGLSAILVFIGAKMLAKDFWHPPHWMSLSVIVALLAIAIAASIVASRRESANSESGMRNTE